jgi:hypothetical protein
LHVRISKALEAVCLTKKGMCLSIKLKSSLEGCIGLVLFASLQIQISEALDVVDLSNNSVCMSMKLNGTLQELLGCV